MPILNVVAETPVPLPLVILLVALAVASLATSFRNPLNRLAPLTAGDSFVNSTRKAISLQRIDAISRALEKYNDFHGRLPRELSELTPHYLDPSLLQDPWGNPYKYLQPANRYLVIGFTADGKADTDLLLSRAVGAPPAPSGPRPEPGGIRLIE